MSDHDDSRKRDERDLTRTNTESMEKRRQKADEKWKVQPIEQFKNHKDNLTGKDRRDLISRIKQFENYLIETVNSRTNIEVLGPRDAVRQDVADYIDDELDPNADTAPTTVKQKLEDILQFYETLNQKKAYAGNPVTEPLRKYRENHDFGTGRPHIPKHRISEFLNWLNRPLSRALWTLAFKLGPRISETSNLDLWCLNINHPVFNQMIEEHGIKLHSKVRDRPDTIYVYGNFNRNTEVPNEGTNGRKNSGEIRSHGNKRKNDDGSVLPLDSEAKTALIEWLLMRPSTAQRDFKVHPVFTTGTAKVRRLDTDRIMDKLWQDTSWVDSIQHFAEEESLAGENCPTCGANQLIESNPADAEESGRRWRCRSCTKTHWRSIYWDGDDEQAQRVTYHQGRHSFSNAHNPKNSGLYDGAIPDVVRKEAIRGDSNKRGDTEDQIYIDGQYRDFEADVREPYLDAIWKFGIYDNPIPAVGEGWER